MTMRLATREVRATIHVEGEEPCQLEFPAGMMTAYHVSFRWTDTGNGWQLLSALVNGHRHRADGTVGVHTGRMNYADAYSPSGWVPNAPAWLKMAAQRLHPATYQTPSELTPTKED